MLRTSKADHPTLGKAHAFLLRGRRLRPKGRKNRQHVPRTPCSPPEVSQKSKLLSLKPSQACVDPGAFHPHLHFARQQHAVTMPGALQQKPRSEVFGEGPGPDVEQCRCTEQKPPSPSEFFKPVGSTIFQYSFACAETAKGQAELSAVFRRGNGVEVLLAPTTGVG